MRMNDLERSKRPACFVSLSFAGLVVLARSLNPIPSRTRPLNSSAPMVLWLKPWESRSLPGLPRTKQFLFTCHDQTKRRLPSGKAAFLFWVPWWQPAKRLGRKRALCANCDGRRCDHDRLQMRRPCSAVRCLRVRLRPRPSTPRSNKAQLSPDRRVLLISLRLTGKSRLRRRPASRNFYPVPAHRR